MNSSKVIKFYGTTWCPDCIRAKTWLNANKVPFEEINIEKNDEALSYVQKINGGNQSVPTIVFPDNSILVEPSNKELEEKIEKLLTPN